MFPLILCENDLILAGYSTSAKIQNSSDNFVIPVSFVPYIAHFIIGSQGLMLMGYRAFL